VVTPARARLIVGDNEISKTRRPRPDLGCCATEKILSQLCSKSFSFPISSCANVMYGVRLITLNYAGSKTIQHAGPKKKYNKH